MKSLSTTEDAEDTGERLDSTQKSLCVPVSSVVDS
jgi:hypothetical protein